MVIKAIYKLRDAFIVSTEPPYFKIHINKSVIIDKAGHKFRIDGKSLENGDMLLSPLNHNNPPTIGEFLIID